jgi:3-methyladenine DNA glycosylase AlkD
MVYQKIIKELKKLSDPKRAISSQRFFKTGKGEYGEGDIFSGIRVPDIRKVIGEFFERADFEDVQKLIDSKIHEERLAGVLVLVKKYQKNKDKNEKKKIFDFYLKNSQKINNWDLVDLSAHKIVGDFLWEKKNKNDLKLFYKMAGSKNMWERRIAIVATWRFIQEKDFELTLGISEMLFEDPEDLLHKASGWMLREVGKKDKNVLVDFLEKNVLKMQRVCLRYAIEKFDEKTRKYFLGK